MTVAIAAFYRFVRLDDPAAERTRLAAELCARQMRGTLIVAPEGINGTLSGPPDAVQAFIGGLTADPRFVGLSVKRATAADHPFAKLKVKLKPEIITFRRPEADATVRTAERIAPQDWNRHIADPNVLVIDTRNAFEVSAGTFPGAINPDTRRFSDFPAFVAAKLDPARHRRIAMFCTGGIRCEKASAYLLAHGFEEVVQLDGGILAYLAADLGAQNRWQGACVVFDDRESVTGPERAAAAAVTAPAAPAPRSSAASSRG